MRGTSENLGRRWQKAAALTLTLSLLNQQGLLISEACAQAVVGRAASGAVVAPVVPVTPVAPSQSAPTLAPFSVSPLSLTPALTMPSVSLPSATAPKAASAASAATAAQAAAAAPLALPASGGVKAAAASAPIMPARVEAQGTGRSSGEVGALRELGKTLSKGRVQAAPALSLAFDGARRSAANGISEPVAGGRLSAARSGLEPAPAEKASPAEAAVAKAPAPSAGRKFVEFNVQYLKDIKKLFAESATKPNKQDYMFLVTKTFGLNLAVRVAFAIKGVSNGDLGLTRAILSTAWYQLQDAFFTVFGQTYMKFLGKMTGMLRIGNAKIGDLLFVYVQLVASEFVNRLVLGPIGENPLVYSFGGIGLLLLNNLQGMVSGGLLVPVINKMRAAGLISEKTSNYLYQAASLTMHLGLLATFGYQGLFTVLTTALMILSWTAYIGLSFFAKPKPGLEPKL